MVRLTPDIISTLAVSDRLSFLYILPNIQLSFKSIFPHYDNHGLHHYNGVETLIYIMFSYGLRFSEMTNIVSGDMITLDMILIRGRKKSNSCMISCPEISHQIMNYGYTKNDLLLFNFSYFTIYNFMQKFNLNNFYFNHKNKIVTHGGRHFLADRLRKTAEPSVVTECLRHKNKNNAAFYGGQKVGKNGND